MDNLIELIILITIGISLGFGLFYVLNAPFDVVKLIGVGFIAISCIMATVFFPYIKRSFFGD